VVPAARQPPIAALCYAIAALKCRRTEAGVVVALMVFHNMMR
jgi:hypothetical protein